MQQVTNKNEKLFQKEIVALAHTAASYLALAQSIFNKTIRSSNTYNTDYDQISNQIVFNGVLLQQSEQGDLLNELKWDEYGNLLEDCR
jgi:hypothetical protein